MRTPLILIALALAAAVVPAQSWLTTIDGRTIHGAALERVPRGVRLVFAHGEVVLPERRVAASSLDPAPVSAGEDPRPGRVYFVGKWRTRRAVTRLLDKRETDRATAVTDAIMGSSWPDRRSLEGRRCKVWHTIPREEAQRLAGSVERFSRVFARTWSLPARRGARPLRIWLHRRPIPREKEGESIEPTLGVYRFMGSPRFELRTEPLLEARWEIETIEGATRHLLADLVPRFVVPEWLMSGIALYEAGGWDGARHREGVVRAGQLALVKDATKAQKQPMTVKELMVAKHVTATTAAFCWSLVHHLLTGRHEKKFRRFCRLVAGGDGIERERFGDLLVVPQYVQIAALLKALKLKSLSDLDASWHASLAAAPDTGLVGLTEAGLDALCDGLPIKASRFLEGARLLRSDTVEMYAALGNAYLKQGRFTPAAAAFRRAVARDPLEGRFHLALALCLEGSSGKRTDEVVRLRLLAVEVDPDDLLLRQALLD